MKIERVWSMPNQWTFKIPAIAKLLREEMHKEELGEDKFVWLDPFAGEYSPATLRNDIEETHEAEYHMDALEFLKSRWQDCHVEGVLFDPPYSVEQCLRCYTPKFKGTAGRAEYWAKCKDEIAGLVRVGGKVISFGWDSCGCGKKRGFEITRILLVCHGACHNDTIVTVEKKIQHQVMPEMIDKLRRRKL